MRFCFLRFCILVVTSVIFIQGAYARVEFSADLKQTSPVSGTQSGKIFVGDNVMRSEYEANGNVLVQILNNTRKEVILIKPGKKSFMRRKAAAGEAMPAARDAKVNPCEGVEELECRQAGQELVNGRVAKKWKFSGVRKGNTAVMTTWIDEVHGFPVKQEMPDGSSMEMKMLGLEIVVGRKVEKWELIARSVDGKESRSVQWYDPELSMNIREEHPGGHRRELLDIKVQAQGKDLLAVPAGYIEVVPQPPGKR